MVFFIKRAANGIWYGTFAPLQTAGVKHGFATRLGGVSPAPFASLNVGLRVGDDVSNAVANRQALCQAVGVDFSRVVTTGQVHGDQVAVVTASDTGRGLNLQGVAGTDALITADSDVPLMIFYADCVPLLFFDPVRRVAGACHAGWRGSAAGIAANVLGAMSHHFGTAPADCLVAIGPAIGPCCYEVDEPVIDAIQKSFPWWEETVIPYGTKWCLDLAQLNRRQLLDSGAQDANILLSRVCTSCNTPLFFSYRAEKQITGVQAAIICL